jgi:hypothetical protein
MLEELRQIGAMLFSMMNQPHKFCTPPGDAISMRKYQL